MVNNTRLFLYLSILVFILTACVPESQAPLPTPTTEPSPTPESTPEPEEWDLVWISDSTGFGAAEVYAEGVAEDLGVTVNLHDAAENGLEARRVLAILRGEDSTSFEHLATIAEAIKEAEIVVFYANPRDPYNEGIYPGDWNCISENVAYVNQCDITDFEAYIAVLEEIFQFIFDLKAGEPVIIRAYNCYQPLVGPHQAIGAFEDCRACWETYSQAIEGAATVYGIPVADVYSAFNGPDHDEDPREKGYILLDGQHPSWDGEDLISDTLRALGYEVTEPPG